MPLALGRDPGPTPSVGDVTGDMKRRESNETRIVTRSDGEFWWLELQTTGYGSKGASPGLLE